MPSFLVETFLARGDARERTLREQRARSAAAEATRGGEPVRFDRAIHIPEDEVCFYVFDAESSRAAAAVATRAELGPLRIVEAAPSGEE